MAVCVTAAEAEEARARMLAAFPQGFEERDDGDGLELAAYTNAAGEERVRAAFGSVRVEPVAAGWEDRWRDFHRPVRIGPLWVGPPWEAPPPELVPVVIDPGRAFGTGAHATTRLCLELVLEAGGGSLLDVGCGSGVLSIAAAKIGFSPVTAIDLDPQALDATTRNAERNGVSVEVRLADAFEAALPEADVVVANIALAPVEALGGRVFASRLITSGYYAESRPVVVGFRPVDRRVDGTWAADLHLPE